ncbi:peptidylprolyl isomerase [Ideonella sp. DXS29W]|uniref:peptidylprolyl isomerase n=1 Tax=Ideonella lacteola TaxID=2984193 RepID=A0ABU9BPW3_9BURK
MSAIDMAAMAETARVNGVALHTPGAQLTPDLIRQLACTELLRQEAIARGYLHDTGDPRDTTNSVAGAIEALLEDAFETPEPTEEACRCYFEANAARYAHGERLALRHVLFAVTPGVNVLALRQRAEALLFELRCAEPTSDDFGQAARRWSNCPTGARGGELGWTTRDDCAPELAQEVFGQQTIGVLPRLVQSRFGFHIVEITRRESGLEPSFEQVKPAVAMRLKQQAWAHALRQYLLLLAGRARLEGVALEGSFSPLVQ